MEYWGYVSRGKGFISDEYDTASDVMGRGKTGFMGWESNSENQDSEELGFHQTAKKSYFVNNPVQESPICGVASERESTPVTSTTNTCSWEEESSSKVSSSVVESKAKGSSLVDLNLGRFADRRDLNASREAPVLSPEVVAAPARRVRGGLGSVTPYCIVHGCMKDLSSSKEYHRRHKVCEIHSKTAKVLVNGIEQRFCQQCSRFHLLTEFDDGKRSCRKRLAGHNERRRKPQEGFHSGKTERILESYIVSSGSRPHGVPQVTSFVCEDILPNNLQRQHKSGTNDWSKRRKLEGGSICYPPLAMATHDFDRCYPPSHANAVHVESWKDSSKNINRIPHDMEVRTSISGPTENEDISFFGSASTAQGLSGISTASRALSLLSPQSHNSSGIPIGQRVSVSENYSHYNASQRSEKLLGVGLQASTSVLQHKFNSTVMGTAKGHYSSPGVVNYPNENFQGSQQMKRNDQSSRDNGPTISLRALSSQLQRLEQRRRSMQVNQDRGGS